jgi:hypothetical protein
MDVVMMTLLLFAALWSSSVPSSVYLLQALVMLIKVLRSTAIRRMGLFPALVNSASLVIFKVAMISLFRSGDNSTFFNDKHSSLELLGRVPEV